MRTRRNLLKTGGLALASVTLAGCSSTGDDGSTGDETTMPSGDSTDSGAVEVGPEAAVAAEWNAMRARGYDALALGLTGENGAGADLARDVFAKFEQAGGEWGAHEALERTSHEHYEEFEEALGELAQEGLSAGDLDRSWTEAGLVSEHLRAAQVEAAGEGAANALELLGFATRAQDAAWLAAAGKTDAAATVAERTVADFEDADAHEALEEASRETYQAFEVALDIVVKAAENGDPTAARERADDALAAAVEGAYALVPPEVAGAGHLAAMQAQGYDAAALTSMGGPSTDFAHAAALNAYRLRVHDATWLAAAGEAERAKTIVQDVFADFEEAHAHEAIEEANHDAYEGFEGSLADLTNAIEVGDAYARTAAVAAVDENLLAGIEALTGGSGSAILEATYFRGRVQDAREQHQLDDSEAAAGIVEDLFARFEENVADFHEAFEHADHNAYESFEEHLGALRDAFEAGDDAAVETETAATLDALLGFQTTVGSTAQISAGEAGYVAGRGFDAAAVAVLGDGDRADAIVEATFQHFEEGAGGFHEAIEDGDHDRYESFEAKLGAMNGADDRYAAAKAFDEEAIAAAYAVIAAAGGSHTDAAKTLVQGVFAAFETAQVHELLEEGDHDTYESFEGALADYIGALDDGAGVAEAAEAFATATLRAQFAVVGAIEQAPEAGESGGDHDGHNHSNEQDLSGGPNVVEGVPEDADHVVEMHAVSYEPAELTVKAGETVAWKHVGGEPHTVSAYESDLPEGATYWASGGFDSEDAAIEGWEEGAGAVQSGQSYVHTFETTGEHPYYCIPHEAAGMTGTIIVE